MSKFIDAIKKRIASFKAVKGKVARVGIIEHQHYDDGTPVAFVANIHEYGSPSNKIPARPFFRPTIAEKRDNWSKKVQRLLKQGKSPEEALELVGMQAAGDVFETLSELMSPPLAVSTKIARNRRAHKPRKGKNGRLITPKPKAISIKPLIDTKRLSTSISSDVVEKGSE